MTVAQEIKNHVQAVSATRSGFKGVGSRLRLAFCISEARSSARAAAVAPCRRSGSSRSSSPAPAMAASAASARCAPFSSAAAALHHGKAEFGATRIRSSAATAASASPSARARAHIAVGGGRFAASQTAVLNISTVHSLSCLGAGHRRHQRKTQDICSSSSSQVRCRVWGWRSSLGSSSTKPANAPARGSGSDDPSVGVVEVGEEGDEGKQSEEVVTSTTAATAVVNDEGRGGDFQTRRLPC